MQEFVFFSRRYQGRHFYDAPANEHASRMAATPCPITYVVMNKYSRSRQASDEPRNSFFHPGTANDSARVPDAGTGVEKVPRHFVGRKSVANVAAVFLVIGHCQRILFFTRLNYGTRDRREGGKERLARKEA